MIQKSTHGISAEIVVKRETNAEGRALLLAEECLSVLYDLRGDYCQTIGRTLKVELC